MEEEKIDPARRIIFMDIDGVLANCEHRLHYIQGETKDYDKFYADEAIDHDWPIQEHGGTFIAGLQNAYAGRIVFCTGRPERTRKSTAKWLEQWYGVENPEMLMRKNHDFRPAPIVKSEAIKKYSETHEYDACICIDDVKENTQAMVDAVPEGIRALGMVVTEGTKWEDLGKN